MLRIGLLKPKAMYPLSTPVANAALREPPARPSMSARAPEIVGALIVALGVTVMIGWVFRIPELVRIVPGFIAMVFNTALCFILAGVALVVRTARARRALAIVLATIAATVWTQDFFRIDLGIDQIFLRGFMPDSSPFPGRMAPQTCICFLLSAFCIFAMTLPYQRWLSIVTQAVTIIIAVAGFLSLIGYSLQLELIYSWYRYTRMAVHTAGGFAVLALGLWLAWFRTTLAAGAFEEHEDQRINFIGGALIVIVAVTAGISGFALLARHTEQIALHSLSIELDGQVRSLENMFEERAADVELFTRAPSLSQRLEVLNKDSRDQEALVGLQDWSHAAITREAVSIGVYTANGSLVASTGEAWASAPINIRLTPSMQLLWLDSVRLRIRAPVRNARGEQIGLLDMQLRAPLIDELVQSTAKMSATADLRICGIRDDVTMQCLPTRLVAHAAADAPRSIRGVELPISLALRGESGARIFLNYRERNSVGAYGQLPNAHLALAVQQETADTYAVIRAPLGTLFVFLAGLVIAAILILRWQVAPLVRKTMAAKAEAASNATRVAAIMDSVPDGIITIDDQGNIVETNPAVSTLFGYAKDELIGRNFTVLMAEPMYAALEVDDARNACSDEVGLIGRGATEAPAIRKDGREFLMQLSLTEMMLDEKRFVVGIMRDVTERKAAERLKDEFISVVSHELRTPLTSISGSLGLMAAGAGGELPPKATRLVQIANQNSERLAKLINDILDLEKAKGGKLQLASEAQSLRPIVEHAIEANQPYAQRLGVSLVLEPSSADAIVTVDRDRLSQVLTNIISNAAKFSPSGECVRVSIANSSADTIRIEVADRGSGIPESFRPRMFQKFAQADSSDTRAKGGTGLGLSIAKSLIESMGGSIDYDSSVAGTTFHVTLLCADLATQRRGHVA
jgi:PAS domain S-box-containing protein